ncbi:MAG: acyl carrier protein [Dehalococcoidia bacterium]|nr:acyl carrier protein [Dehalococcoidia bacterium]
MSDAIRPAVERVLHELRPEADLETLPAGADLREELDLDSMDFLNFVIGVHEATGVDIPEADYARVSTLETCLEYLEQHAGA